MAISTHTTGHFKFWRAVNLPGLRDLEGFATPQKKMSSSMISTLRLSRGLLVIGLLFLFFEQGKTQQTDTIPPAPQEEYSIRMDSVAGKKVHKVRKPRTALLLSFALPGAGQVYNHSYWKLPLVYGAIGGSIYWLSKNQTNYRLFKGYVQADLAKEPYEVKGRYSITTLRNIRDIYDKRTQVAYVLVVASYGLVALEAFVDAHLQDFDLNEDLSFKIKPKLQLDPLLGQPMPGIGLVFYLNNHSKTK